MSWGLLGVSWGNFDNVALGRLPTSVTTDSSVIPLRELGYLPDGVMDPHDLPTGSSRAGKLPTEIIDERKIQEKQKQEDIDKSNTTINNSNLEKK